MTTVGPKSGNPGNADVSSARRSGSHPGHLAQGAAPPGLAKWEVFHDPKDGEVRLEVENVLGFPKLPEFGQATLKVEKP
jgi:hypothetical protein